MKKQILLFSFLTLIVFNSTYPYNPEHLSILLNRNIPNSWTQWRKKNLFIKPDLSEALIEGVVFSGDFSYVNLQKTRITCSKITEAKFLHTDLSYAVLEKIDAFMGYGSNISPLICNNSNFYRARILNSEFMHVQFIDVNFREAEIKNTKIDTTTFKRVSFVKAIITNSELWYIFYDIDFSYAKIFKSLIFSGFTIDKKLSNIIFYSATINESILAGSLNKVNFIDANLTGSSFYYLNIPDGSILTNVNFTNANLTNVNFQKAKFQNVIFKNADMTGAKLERKWYSYVKKQGVRNFDKINWQ